jgi:hypothetical protein
MIKNLIPYHYHSKEIFKKVSYVRSRIILPALLFSLLCCAAEAFPAGDCDGNGTVTISEVQSSINMFLGLQQPALCVDEDKSGSVSIAEVQKTINTFLGLLPTNRVPVAHAGATQNVVVNALVTLDGSGSSDADNDPLTYSWSLISKPNQRCPVRFVHSSLRIKN